MKNPTSQPRAAGQAAQNSDAYRRTYEACQAGGMNNTDSHEMAMDHPTRALPVAAHTPTPLACTFDPATESDSGFISIWRNDDQPDASLVGRLVDTPRNREVAAFIVRACNSHAALVEALLESAEMLHSARCYHQTLAVSVASEADQKHHNELARRIGIVETKARASIELNNDSHPAPIADLNHALNREIDRRDSKAPFAS